MTAAAIARIITENFDPPPEARAAQRLLDMGETSAKLNYIKLLHLVPEPWLVAVENAMRNEERRRRDNA